MWILTSQFKEVIICFDVIQSLSRKLFYSRHRKQHKQVKSLVSSRNEAKNVTFVAASNTFKALAALLVPRSTDCSTLVFAWENSFNEMNAFIILPRFKTVLSEIRSTSQVSHQGFFNQIFWSFVEASKTSRNAACLLSFQKLSRILCYLLIMTNRRWFLWYQTASKLHKATTFSIFSYFLLLQRMNASYVEVRFRLKHILSYCREIVKYSKLHRGRLLSQATQAILWY